MVQREKGVAGALCGGTSVLLLLCGEPLMIIRVTKYLPVGSFETTFEVKKQVCSLMTLGK